MSELKINIKIAVLIDEFKARLKEVQDTLRALGAGGSNLNLTSNADALKAKILELKNQLNLLNSGAGVNLTSNADELKNKIKELERELGNLGSRTGNLNLGGGRVKQELDGIKDSAVGAESGLMGIKSTLVGLFTIGALVAFANKLVDTVQVIQDLRLRLSGLTKSNDDYAASDAYLTDLAHRHHKSVSELTDGYSKLLVMEQAGVITRQQSMQLLEGFSNVMSKTGASAVSTSQALYGLSQALSQGTVQTAEMNQIFEPLAGLGNEVAKAFGLESVGILRKLVGEGQITSEMFGVKMVQAMKAYEGAAARSAGTITASYADVNTAYIEMARTLEKPVASAAVGAVDVGKSAYGWIKDNGDAIIVLLSGIAATMAGKVLGSLANYSTAKAGAIAVEQAHNAALITNADLTLVSATNQRIATEADLQATAQQLALVTAEVSAARAEEAATVGTTAHGNAVYRLNAALAERAVLMGKMSTLGAQYTAQTAAQTEATVALTAVTTASGVVVTRLGAALKAAFSFVGGWVGVAVLALWGMYEILNKVTDAEGQAAQKAKSLSDAMGLMNDEVKKLTLADVDIDFSKTEKSIESIKQQIKDLEAATHFGNIVENVDKRQVLQERLAVAEQHLETNKEKKLDLTKNFDASTLAPESLPTALKETQNDIDKIRYKIEELKRSTGDANTIEAAINAERVTLAAYDSKLSAIQGAQKALENAGKVDPKIAEAQAKSNEKSLESDFKLKEQLAKNAYELATASAGKDSAKKLQIDRDYNEQSLKLTLERLDAEKAAKIKTSELSGKKTKAPELQAELTELENKRTLAIADAETQRGLLGIKGTDNAEKLQESKQSAQFEIEKNRIDVELAKAQAESKTAIEELKRLKDEGTVGGSSGKFDNEIKAASQKHGFNYEAVQSRFTQSAAAHGVPEDLLRAQVKQESSFNPNVGSSAGAYGFSQFIKGTATQYGLSDRSDPIASIEAQAKMMGEKIRQYGGRLDLALAAYNGGDGGANYLAKNPQYMSNPDRNAPASAWKNQTGGYVKNIMASYGGGKGSGANEQQLTEQSIAGTQHFYEAKIKAEAKGIEASITAVKARLALAEKEYSAKKATATPEELPKIEADFTTNKAKLTQELSQLQHELLAIKKTGDAEMVKEIAKSKQDEIDLEEKSALELVKVAETEAQQQLELGQLSNSKFLEKQRTFEAQRYQIALKASQDRRALLADGDTVGKTKEYSKEKAASNKFAADMKANNHKMALDSQKSFTAAFSPIKSAFGSTIQGILQGTTTLKQGMKNAFQSIVLSYASSLSNMAIDSAAHWLWELLGFGAKETSKAALKTTSEAAQTGATIVGTQSRVAAETTASAESKAIELTSGMSKITTKAATAAAGAYDAMVGIPYVGPIIAPIAAAVAFAGVMAFGGLMSSAGGEWDVPQDRLNLVHKNETILPATIAAPMREFFTNGGIGNVGLPVQANPTDSAASVGLAVTASSALATQQAMMQTQQKQQSRNSGGSVVINTKGGDFIHKDDLAKVLRAENRNFRTIKQ
ncbi:MAG: tape measure protein [Methylococcales bacterium]|nr:tape measure protein [Methylococcales bacterium]